MRRRSRSLRSFTPRQDRLAEPGLARSGGAFLKRCGRPAASSRLHTAPRARSPEPLARADRDPGVRRRGRAIACRRLPMRHPGTMRTAGRVPRRGAGRDHRRHPGIRRRCECPDRRQDHPASRGPRNVRLGEPAARQDRCLQGHVHREHSRRLFRLVAPRSTAVAFRDSVLNYAPMDITANAGEDYTASSGSLTIKRGGYLSERAPIYFIDDSTDEHDETMAFQITVVRGRIMARGLRGLPDRR